MSWFSTGYEKVAERAKEVEEALNKDYLPDFFMSGDEDTSISFVTIEPFNYNRHYVQAKKRYYTCSQDGECVLCNSGNKASFSSAYLIIDHRHEKWVDKQGKNQERKDTLKLASFGIKTSKALAAIHKKRPLNNHIWEVTRTGTGNDTAYTFMPAIEGLPMKPDLKGKDPIKDIIMGAIAPKPRDQLLRLLAGSGLVVGGSGGGNTGGQSQGTYDKPKTAADMLDMSEDPDVVDLPY